MERWQKQAGRVYRWLDRFTRERNRLLVVAAGLFSIWWAMDSTRASVPVPKSYIELELSEKGDIHNLYYAALNATWADAPKWFVGPWNYPGVRYYRPLTSIFFLVEQRAYGTDFTAYNRITWYFHGLNACLLFLLVVSLLSHHPKARILLGLVAVKYFATPDSSLNFGVHAVLHWWPAQNDATCLGAALLFLILLDRHLKINRRGLLYGALVAYAASICFKETGYVAGLMGLGLVWYRKRRIDPAIWAIIAVSLAFWTLRWLTVPKPYGESYLQWKIVRKLAQYWGGPIYVMATSKIWWPIVACALITIIVHAGLRWRAPVAWIAATALVVTGLCAHFIQEDGNWALLFDSFGVSLLISVVTVPLALAVFWRYRWVEPGAWVCACWLIAYLPFLHLVNYHYHYWPGAVLGIMDAVFCACLWRWAVELRTQANWTLSWRRPTPAQDSACIEAQTA